ncbi:hypothetical protein NQ317_006422 [Molorchus minor]|uniref:Uncharacterized protein n=1 Tax=Molorchus minor TaxID=1323400 RepID=A0ABQ9JYD5_9CUCU|nr:hypothetical protein NQ317_006422 [Molorchus minor]
MMSLKNLNKTIELTGESKVSPTLPKEKERESLENYTPTHKEKTPRKRNEESRDRPSKESEQKSEEETSSYEEPSHYSSSRSDGDHSGSSSESKEKSKKPDYSHDFSDFDEYHYKLFPEFAKSESKREEDVREYQIPAATKQNVESVLAEFSKKDRSNCKKAEKKGMTCYLCVDKNNIQHEECMYVQESRPQSSHVAYHQVKAVKDKPEDATPNTPSQYQPNLNKVTTPSPAAVEAAASEQVGVFVKLKPDPKAAESVRKEKRSNDDKERKDFDDESDGITDKNDPTIKTPEVVGGPEEGVHSEETRPVFSKALGVKLPKYMLEKSEFEKEFDEFAGSF